MPAMITYFRNTPNTIQSPDDDNRFKIGYSGDGGPPMDANERLARLETSFGHMQNDLRDIKTELHNTKWWFLSTIFTILFGVAGVVYWQSSWYQHSLDQSREEWKATLAAQKAEQDRKDAEWKAAQDKKDAEWKAAQDKRDAEWNARMDKNEARWDRMLDELHSQDKRISKIESK